MKHIALLALLLTGCATSTPRPQVVIEGVKREEVKEATANMMVNRGWLPVSTDPLMLGFEKDMPFGAQFFLQELGSQPAKHRMFFTLLSQTNAVRVIGNLQTITTHFGAPQSQENRQQDRQVQYLLECIRASMLSLAMPTNPGVATYPGQVYTGKSPFGVTRMKTKTN